jgi:hypothetical protein
MKVDSGCVRRYCARAVALKRERLRAGLRSCLRPSKLHCLRCVQSCRSQRRRRLLSKGRSSMLFEIHVAINAAALTCRCNSRGAADQSVSREACCLSGSSVQPWFKRSCFASSAMSSQRRLTVAGEVADSDPVHTPRCNRNSYRTSFDTRPATQVRSMLCKAHTSRMCSR